MFIRKIIDYVAMPLYITVIILWCCLMIVVWVPLGLVILFASGRSYVRISNSFIDLIPQLTSKKKN